MPYCAAERSATLGGEDPATLCEGKAAVATGFVGKGVGRNIVLTLARDGARVVVNYRTSQESATAIVKHIRVNLAQVRIVGISYGDPAYDVAPMLHGGYYTAEVEPGQDITHVPWHSQAIAQHDPEFPLVGEQAPAILRPVPELRQEG